MSNIKKKRKIHLKRLGFCTALLSIYQVAQASQIPLPPYAALEASFGLPYAWLMAGETLDQISTKPNVKIGTAIGYEFFKAHKVQAMPTIGLRYQLGGKRIMFADGLQALKENFIEIPFKLNIIFKDQKKFITAEHLILGYDMQIMFRSMESSFPNISTYRTRKNAPRLSGDIVFGSRTVFYSGVYMTAVYKFPIEVFSIIGAPPSLSKKYSAIRAAKHSAFEFGIGIDLTAYFTQQD